MNLSILERHRVSVTGSGSQTMILAHGFGTTQQSLRAQVAAFRTFFRYYYHQSYDAVLLWY
ncbi:MAG: hypothetical protein M3R61_11720 [Chloroflexota bacterium]|nr:hypothetical protein [Chloroflexota bacterium]